MSFFLSLLFSPILSTIQWQTLLSCTLHFIHILKGLATTLVHARLWGVYRKLLLSLYSRGWQKRPLKRLSHPSFSMSLPLPLSLFIFLSPFARPKGFCQIELNQYGPCSPHSQPVCVWSLDCPYTEMCSQPQGYKK